MVFAHICTFRSIIPLAEFYLNFLQLLLTKDGRVDKLQHCDSTGLSWHFCSFSLVSRRAKLKVENQTSDSTNSIEMLSFRMYMMVWKTLLLFWLRVVPHIWLRGASLFCWWIAWIATVICVARSVLISGAAGALAMSLWGIKIPDILAERMQSNVKSDWNSVFSIRKGRMLLSFCRLWHQKCRDACATDSSFPGVMPIGCVCKLRYQYDVCFWKFIIKLAGEQFDMMILVELSVGCSSSKLSKGSTFRTRNNRSHPSSMAQSQQKGFPTAQCHLPNFSLWPARLLVKSC